MGNLGREIMGSKCMCNTLAMSYAAQININSYVCSTDQIQFMFCFGRL